MLSLLSIDIPLLKDVLGILYFSFFFFFCLVLRRKIHGDDWNKNKYTVSILLKHFTCLGLLTQQSQKIWFLKTVSWVHLKIISTETRNKWKRNENTHVLDKKAKWRPQRDEEGNELEVLLRMPGSANLLPAVLLIIVPYVLVSCGH